MAIAITITVPVYNEAHRLGTLLESIRFQDYPQERVEILVIDGGSTDATRDIARRYGCEIVDNPERNQEIGKKIGALRASGDLHMYMDADMEWTHENCFAALAAPWREHDALIGAFPRYAVDRTDLPFNRYLSYDPLYRDALMRFLSPSIDDCVVSHAPGYSLCRFHSGRAPIVGIVLYKTAFVHHVIRDSRDDWLWSDVDFVIAAAESADGLIAYVPRAAIYHRSALSPGLYLRKLRRNVETTYLPTVGKRRASYVRWDDPADIARLLLWVLYANLVVPGLVRAAAKAIRKRDGALLYYAWSTTVGTDYVLFQFAKDARGRALIRKAVVSVLRGLRPGGVGTPRAGE